MLNRYLETFKETINQPRNVTDGFIHSGKIRYQHPFLFCLIGMALVFVLSTLLVDFSFEPKIAGTDLESDELREMAVTIQMANIRASTQFLPVMMVFLLIPLLSVPGLFFFRDEMDGFYANLILNSYAVGAAMIPLLAMIPVWIFLDLPLTDPFMNTTLPAALVASICIWVYKQYFHISSVSGWIRILSSYISGYVLFVIMNGFISGVIGYLIFAINRIMELSGSA
jgi:hypothetical protein